MAYSGQTTHYGLPKYVSTDKPSWLDTNDAFDAIDAAIYNAATAIDPSTITTMQNDITALQSGKQDVLTFDAAPASGSVNPVTSGGVYTAVNNVSIALGVTDLKVSTLEGAMGNTDISAIGDGTVTGAISSINAIAGSELIHAASANQTYAVQLADLKTYFDALSDDRKRNARLVTGNSICLCSDIRGIFSYFYIGTNTTDITSFALNTSKAYESLNGTVSDISNNTNSSTFELYA